MTEHISVEKLKQMLVFCFYWTIGWLLILLMLKVMWGEIDGEDLYRLLIFMGFDVD